MKQCNADQCEGYHEGYCIIDLIYDLKDGFVCDAKSNADLMTEDEFLEVIK